MKTIREWLEELPEPYRTQALENMKNDKPPTNPDEPPVTGNTLDSALEEAFIWYKSPQNRTYWFDVFCAIQRGEL